MNRRDFLIKLTGLMSLPLIVSIARAREQTAELTSEVITKIFKSKQEWKSILTPQQYYVLRQEGTEKAFSSPLNNEKRKGTYVCAGCDLPLFTSEMKFNSGTGWPSFYTSIPDRLETKIDFKMILPRTEYHCARCGGHQGHIFKDGPKPTGERWCNNGLALNFVPD